MGAPQEVNLEANCFNPTLRVDPHVSCFDWPIKDDLNSIRTVNGATEKLRLSVTVLDIRIGDIIPTVHDVVRGHICTDLRAALDHQSVDGNGRGESDLNKLTSVHSFGLPSFSLSNDPLGFLI